MQANLETVLADAGAPMEPHARFWGPALMLLSVVCWAVVIGAASLAEALF
jgi:hypothetical protein